MLTIHLTKKQLIIIVTSIILAAAIPAIAQYCVLEAPQQAVVGGGMKSYDVSGSLTTTGACGTIVAAGTWPSNSGSCSYWGQSVSCGVCPSGAARKVMSCAESEWTNVTAKQIYLKRAVTYLCVNP